MSKIDKYKCDHCGTEVANRYMFPGWLHISGEINRSWGEYIGTSYMSDFLQSGHHDFCCIGCFVAALDENRARQRRRIKERA